MARARIVIKLRRDDFDSRTWLGYRRKVFSDPASQLKVAKIGLLQYAQSLLAMKRHTAGRSHVGLQRVAEAAIRVAICDQRIDYRAGRPIQKFARKHRAFQTRVAPDE